MHMDAYGSGIEAQRRSKAVVVALGATAATTKTAGGNLHFEAGTVQMYEYAA